MEVVVSERLEFGRFVVEPSLQRLTRDGKVVPLKPKAYDLLCQLLAHRNRVVSKAELLDWLWPRQEISESNLSQTIYELRRALEDGSTDARWIETVPRRGYRFVGKVAASARPATSQAPASLAVLPFLELGDSAEQAHFGLGIADALITALAGLEGLVVRPLSAIARYAEGRQDALEAGRQLQVDAIVEGSFQAGATGTRISTRLLRVADGTCLWADQFTTADRDPFAVEDAVSSRVAEACGGSLAGTAAPPRVSRRTDDPEVHIASMKGWYCWHKWAMPAWMQAIRHFQHALELQPDHAPSQAGLAASWSTLGIFGASPPREAFDNARQAAEKAVALAPDYSRGHEIMGAIHLFHDWDFSAAAHCLDRAIELDPDSCNARHLRALTLAAGGRNTPALAEINRALQADPRSLITLTDVGYIHYWGRRYAQAEQAHRNVLALDPDFAHARQALAYVLVELGDPDRALVELRRAVEQSGKEPGLSGDLAWLLGRMGKKAEAEAIVSALEEQSMRDYVDPYQLVLGYIGLDDRARAFETLKRALHNRSRDLMLMRVDPAIDPIRSDERCEQFLEEAGLAS
jgi:DNA-binding winged helix-turn-helix (wHTH) protein/tetratricopeptide (TPR) repeat protein